MATTDELLHGIISYRLSTATQTHMKPHTHTQKHTQAVGKMATAVGATGHLAAT